MSTHYNIDDGSKPEIQSTPTKDLSTIPVIKVDEREESVPPTPSTSSDCHSRGPSDPSTIPPSPTLSTKSSVYFMASTALQDNKPEGGIISLALIDPTEFSASVSRQPSNVIMAKTDDGTIADQSDDNLKDIKVCRDDLPLFPRLRRGQVSPFSSIFKSRPPRIPNDDRVTL